MDRNEDQYYVPDHEESVQGEDRKYRLLEERLKAVEGQGALGMDLTDLGLVPGVKVPHKFKVPVFEKYNGTTCPKTHVRSYYRKMSVYSSDEKLLMHFFQDSLAGASLEWYMQLESIYIRNWRDLVEAFVKHYHYNIDMAPNRTQLQNLTQGTNESFKEYAHKWRELAVRVQPPLMERELVDMFMGTLQGPYYDIMVGSTSVGFSELVMAGERIEAGLKMGKIHASGTNNGATKKQSGGYAKKGEGEASDAYAQRGRAQYQQYVNVVTIPVPAAPGQHQQPRRNYNPQKPPRVLYPVPIPYSQLLQHLLQLKLVTLRNMPALT